ncbi:MAG: PAS domain S-box protein [Acidobacteriota bacterium]
MEANRAAVEMTGFSEAELRSMTIFDLSAPDSAEAALADFEALLREGRVSSERRIRRKDGSEILISVDANRMQDDRFIGFCSDITERRRSEEERQRLLTAFEQTAESIVVTDLEGDIQYVNPAFEATTGFSWQEAMGRNPRFLKSGKHDAPFYEALWRTIAAGEVWSGRFVNRRKDGSEYVAEATISPVRSAAGRIVSHVGVLRDISAQLDVEAQLVQAQKMESVGRLAGGIAHDFNNLLTVIHGNCSLLSARFNQSDPPQKHLEEITNAVYKAAELTRKLLAFSRRQILQPEVLNLNAVVEDISRMLGRLIGEDIELMTRYGPELGNIKADLGQIEQAILNLVINASDAMPNGGELLIETANLDLEGETAAPHSDAKPGSYVMLAISDTGCGMDEETRRQAFEPFFTTKEGDKGTGLGLSIVYGIVKQSGGQITLISQPEKGAAFKMLFPRVDAALDSPPRPKPALGAVTGSETILIVEDHDSIRELEAEILEGLGYKVLQAGSGAEALSLSKLAASVDLLLSDVVMPGGSGLQVAEAFGRINPKMKVIFASGHDDDILAGHDLLEKGAAFLQKPFGPEDLARKVRQVLNG